MLAPNERNSRLTLSPTSSATVPTAVATVTPSATAPSVSSFRRRRRKSESERILPNNASPSRPRYQVTEKVDSVMLSPIRFAQGRLIDCHSERSEESLSFRAQGKLREASAFQAEKKELRFLASLRMTSPKPFSATRQGLKIRVAGISSFSEIVSRLFSITKWTGFGLQPPETPMDRVTIAAPQLRQITFRPS